jgi:hexokinase
VHILTVGGCVLGAIFGTETNGAYLEQVANITKLGNHPTAAAGGVMMVNNTERGAFDNAREVLPTTPFDSKVDRESINPRFQAYEKLILGMYLGEVTRNVILALVDAAPRPILFNGKSTERLNKHYGLDTEMLSLIEGAWHADASKDSEEEHTALRGFSGPLVEERIAPATLRRLNRVREIVQEHLGFEPGEIGIAVRCGARAMGSGFRRPSCCATQRMRHCCRRSTDGIRHWRREGRTGGIPVS